MVSPQRTASPARVLVLVLGVMLVGASFIPNAAVASSPTTRFTTAPPPTPTPIHDMEKHGG